MPSRRHTKRDSQRNRWCERERERERERESKESVLFVCLDDDDNVMLLKEIHKN